MLLKVYKDDIEFKTEKDKKHRGQKDKKQIFNRIGRTSPLCWLKLTTL